METPRRFEHSDAATRDDTSHARVIRIESHLDRESNALFRAARRLNADLHLEAVMHAVCEETASALRVPAALVTLVDERTGTVTHVRSCGLERTVHAAGPARYERMLGRRRTIVVHDLSVVHQAVGAIGSSPPIGTTALTALMRSGSVIGVLAAISTDEPRTFSPGEMTLLEAMADLATTAIANARMFETEQRLAIEIATAYDATLAGWTRALDLRDRETEGHSRRVAQLTVRLARECALPEEELIHIHRGAMLHDIGKMGLPDSILLKPGGLTPDEWNAMRMHPVHARDMLAPIDYLRPAIDIPFTHHERWDGSGYPRGLARTEIPLSSRVFALADVWDSLRHDRVYRAAWPEDRVIEYVRRSAGVLFDPVVVEIFLQSEPWRRSTAITPA